MDDSSHLKATLNTWQLWGIAVGLVISGEYFGWSYGWASAGTLGFLITTILVATMYTTFIFSFTELTTAIPNAGGPFAYAQRAFGEFGGYIAGASTLIEFIFAPPAIALAIGAYLNVQFPSLSRRHAAVLAYLVFMTVNIIGVRIAADFELFITMLAIIELLVFMAHRRSRISHGQLSRRRLVRPRSLHHERSHGMFAAVPFAIWFFLAIEGVAMAAEEARGPSHSIPIAYIAGIGTLLVLALGVMLFAGSVGDWRLLANINDPLPQAMKIVVGASSGWLHMLVWLGLFGLIASLHGIIFGYSRQIFALARAGYLPCVSRQDPSSTQYALGCNPRRWNRWHRRDLQRFLDHNRRAASHSKYRHDVGARSTRHVRNKHARALSAQKEGAGTCIGHFGRALSVRTHLDTGRSCHLSGKHHLLQQSHFDALLRAARRRLSSPPFEKARCRIS